MTIISNTRISSSESVINHPMSIEVTSSDHTIIKYFLEQHYFKQVNSPSTSDCCPYSVVFSYFNRNTHFSTS